MYEIRAIAITESGERIPVQLQIHATVGAVDEAGDPVSRSIHRRAVTLEIPGVRGHIPQHLALLDMLEAEGWRRTDDSGPTTRRSA